MSSVPDQGEMPLGRTTPAHALAPWQLSAGSLCSQVILQCSVGARVSARSGSDCTASAAGGLRGGRDRAGWERGSWSAAVPAPPAAGEGARRVSVGREREVAAGARPLPSLGPPLSSPHALARET